MVGFCVAGVEVGWVGDGVVMRGWVVVLVGAGAGRLVAFLVGGGFLLAGVTPYLSGLLRDYSGGFVLDWQIHALLVVVLIAITWRFHPHSYRRAFAE